MTSIADLPEDILIAIFHLCVIQATKDEYLSSLKATSPPWILACVSRSWRAITIGTPLLWATIRLPILHYVNCEQWYRAKIVARTQHLLQLTQKCKLDIVILVRHSPNLVWDELMPIICATAPRWQRFTADASHALFSWLQVPETFPYLEHLGLCFSDPYGRSSASAAGETSNKIESFRNAHALRSLSLTAITDNSFTLELLLPWQNITTHSTNMGHMLNASLHLLSSVEELHVELEGEEEDAEDDALMAAAPSAVQVFPRLTILDLAISDGHTHSGALQPSIKTILRRLHAPSLTRLRLRITDFQFISKPLLLHCNWGNLLDLSIHDASSHFSSICLDFWRLTPNVEVLHIEEIRLVDTLLDLLAFPSIPVPLPRLKVLCLHADRLDYPSVVIKVVLQRRGALEKDLWTPLEEIRILDDYFGFVADGIVKKLRQEYERKKRSLPFYEDESIAPLRIYGVRSDF